MLKTRFIVFALAFALIHGVPTDNNGSWRIVGGSDAEEGVAPYQIILKLYGYFSCSGSIISKKTILTAAHCLTSMSPSDISIIAGTNLLNSGGTEYEVERYIMHEDYNWFDSFNDLALIILKKEIEFTDSVSAIAIGKEEILGDVAVTLTGWGMTSFPGGNVSETLRTIDLKSITHDHCVQILGNRVSPEHICTLTKTGEGACHGDSGGPLMANGEIVGIVSWWKPCAIGYPELNIRLSSFADWIKLNMI